MSKNYKLYIEDIQKAAHKIHRYLYDTSFQEFTNDSMCRDAVLHNLDVISTAIEHVPPEVWSQFPTVEWRKFMGMGDIIAHAYFGIDWILVWDIVQHKVPVLRQQIAALEREIA